MPFALLGFDSDNGGEFLKRHLWSYMRERKEAVDFTPSRPYHSDDNAHGEQKNWTWACQLLGYGRLEDPELVAPISALYREVWAPWQDFFLPCLKLKKSGAKAVTGASNMSCPRMPIIVSALREYWRSKRAEPCETATRVWIPSP